EETIARIDATWSCFQCLSTEYASALIDSKRTEEALAYLDRQIDAVKAAGEDDFDPLLYTRADILIELQRYDEARKLIDELTESNDYWGRDRISNHLKKLY
ncbi:tetratricopeptide repeat protein, partial [Escherichia coli]|nr:tetratricopeptide repeat protein [Escherichia coli]